MLTRKHKNPDFVSARYHKTKLISCRYEIRKI
nr:MAG TPA: hypothetical protein [Caudoviricetes sp.]